MRLPFAGDNWANIPIKVRWLVTCIWTGITLFLMLSPADDMSLAKQLSILAGGTEITDAIGHFVLFSVLTLMWYWTLIGRSSYLRARSTAALVALALGIGCELAQVFVPQRGASLLDLSADVLSVLFALWLIHLWIPKDG